MSFVLYNQAAYNYETEAVGIVNPSAIMDVSNMDSQDLQHLQYRFWKQGQSLKPDDYDSFALPQSTVNLLIQEIDNFHFPPSGLRGEAKIEMIEKILDYRSIVASSCWDLRMRLKSLCKFLDRNDVIFHY